jgi:hypothetical protein
MNIPVFPKGARVVFAGDSITNGNKYVCHIAEYYRSHLPELSVQFFNCGISGCSLGTLIAAFDRDIMYYNPTHIVLTIGVNDSGIGYLKDKNEDTYKNLTANYERYKANLEKFAELCKENNIILSLGTTFPYAEYQKGSPDIYKGGYALFKHYADTIREYAERNGYPYCDYHPYLTKIEMFTDLYREDHLHPTYDVGHYYIAKCFLENQGLEIDKNELSPEVSEWHTRTLAVRSIFVTMYENFCLSAPFEEAKAKIQAYLDTADATDPRAAYKIGIAKTFMQNYDAFDANREWLLNF